ncbi:MAG: hypothetical protein AAGA93_23465 [Actinomycetota bacterium]
MTDKRSKARSRLRDAANRLAKESETAIERIDDKTGDGASKTLAGGRRLVRGAIDRSQQLADQGAAKLADTDAGAPIVRGAKVGVETIGQLPGFTAIGDGLQAWQGVPRLAERMQDDPFDPMPPVWLAEALLRSQRHQRTVDLGRAALAPIRIPLVAGAKAVTAVDAEESPIPVVTQLLGRAYVLALARLDGELTTGALHALSRVYLARGAPDEAVRLAQGAVAAGGPDTAEAAITLARAHGHRRALDRAWAASTVAVEHGSTLGHQLHAELSSIVASADAGDDADLPALSNDDRAGLLSLVETDDIARYRGVAPTAGQAIDDLARQQKKRLDAQAPKVRDTFERAKRRLGDDG